MSVSSFLRVPLHSSRVSKSWFALSPLRDATLTKPEFATQSHGDVMEPQATAVNPAILSTTIASLFPSGVVAAELRAPGDASLLLPEEAASVSNAVPKRLQEFA